ncbi:hypothetical protein Y032_0020g203 [Ancylostoma ceylanicum]|nr:hypothetical protein Y032_0020g203 [Ancylostoma ceylanicum]
MLAYFMPMEAVEWNDVEISQLAENIELHSSPQHVVEPWPLCSGKTIASYTGCSRGANERNPTRQACSNARQHQRPHFPGWQTSRFYVSCPGAPQLPFCIERFSSGLFVFAEL